jgi:hypothetical protein
MITGKAVKNGEILVQVLQPVGLEDVPEDFVQWLCDMETDPSLEDISVAGLTPHLMDPDQCWLMWYIPVLLPNLPHCPDVKPEWIEWCKRYPHGTLSVSFDTSSCGFGHVDEMNHESDYSSLDRR